jgi:uncharacterized membrane protein (UPF0182 family)
MSESIPSSFPSDADDPFAPRHSGEPVPSFRIRRSHAGGNSGDLDGEPLDPIGWPPEPPHSQGRRGLMFLLVAAIAIVFFGSRTALSYYVNNLWFHSLGYGDVFLKTLGLQWAVFAVFGLATFGLLFGWFLGLRRACRDDFPADHVVFVQGRPVKLPVDSAMRLIALVAAILIAGLTGAGMMSEWPTFALWLSAPAASGQADPVFQLPLNFYLFTLPVWRLVSGWLLSIAVLASFTAVFFLLVTGSTRALSRKRSGVNLAPWRGFSLAFACLLLTLSARVYLGRYEHLFDSHTVFSGVTYTDAHVTLVGLAVIAAALIAGAIVAATNLVTQPSVRRLVVAVVPAIVCFLGVNLAGWYVVNFVVKPNELVRERPYIENNITLTRTAYGLDQVAQREFPAETSVLAADPDHNQATLRDIRLWDWHALQDTLRQLQEIRTYYDFPDIDIDRYEIDGSLRQVMLAARELNVDKLPESSRNWINDKLIYTHGYGITMNSVNGFSAEGLPTLMLSNMPIQSTVTSIQVKQPDIYFGQLTNTDVYVKTRQQEFDYPQGESNSLTSYQGKGGIELGGFLRRCLIAFDRGDLTKIPFSDDITSESRLLMRRSIQERVSTLAPFLTFDRDPYIIVGDDGRLVWMLDAFTTSNSYPYSSHYMLGDQPINYLRNSVKVVVDAYDGTTSFYVFDQSDPILAAWRRVFPSLFQDASAMPATLRKHVRYPELLLKTQAQVYGLYHMTDPNVFYNREDLWTIATEVGLSNSGDQQTQAMEPNFVLMKLPGESSTEFVEILPFTPANRNNLIGWIAGRSDGEHYGTSIVYDFPKTRLVDGPQQIESRIDQNAQLSGQLTLWNQQGSHVRRGTLLVIPCGKALLYAEPIYLQAERSPMPELRLVVLALQDKLAYGPTYEAALSTLFGGEASSLTAEVGATVQPTPGSSATTAKAAPAASTNPLIRGAAQDLADYQRLTAEGKLGEAGQKLEQLKRKLEQLNVEQK